MVFKICFFRGNFFKYESNYFFFYHETSIHLAIQIAIFKGENNDQVAFTLALVAQQHGNLGQHEDALQKFERVLGSNKN